MKAVYTFYAEAFRIAVHAIVAHKLRAFLTLIGIIIGVASVVVVGASISGLNTYVIDRVSKVLGVNHFMIARMANVGRLSEEEWELRDRRNKRLTWDEWGRSNSTCLRVDRAEFLFGQPPGSWVEQKKRLTALARELKDEARSSRKTGSRSAVQ